MLDCTKCRILDFDGVGIGTTLVGRCAYGRSYDRNPWTYDADLARRQRDDSLRRLVRIPSLFERANDPMKPTRAIAQRLAVQGRMAIRSSRQHEHILRARCRDVEHTLAL